MVMKPNLRLSQRILAILALAFAVWGVAPALAQNSSQTIVEFELQRPDSADVYVCDSFDVNFIARSLIEDSNGNSETGLSNGDQADWPVSGFADVTYDAKLGQVRTYTFQPGWGIVQDPDDGPIGYANDDFYNDLSGSDTGLLNDIGAVTEFALVDGSTTPTSNQLSSFSVQAVQVGTLNFVSSPADEPASETTSVDTLGALTTPAGQVFTVGETFAGVEAEATYGTLGVTVLARPTLQSIVRSGNDGAGNPQDTNANTVEFTVTISANVTGVDQGDFALVFEASEFDVAPSITGFNAVNATTYTVTVDTGTPNVNSTALALAMLDDGSISGTSGNAAADDFVIVNVLNDQPLTVEPNVPQNTSDPADAKIPTKICVDPTDSDAPDQSNFGETYNVDKTPPTVTSFDIESGNFTQDDTFVFEISFSEIVTGLAATDFTIDVDNGGSLTTGDITVTDSAEDDDDGQTYDILVDTSSFNDGTFVITLGLPAGVVQDAATNQNEAAPENATATWTTEATPPDMVATAMNIPTKHALAGAMEVQFTIANQGGAPTGSFDVDIIVADTDACTADPTATVVGTETVSSIAPAGTADVTVDRLQMELSVRQTLFQRAVADDPGNQPKPYEVTNREYLCLVIDPTNVIAEADEGNNSDQGVGVDADVFVYAPYDTQSVGGEVVLGDLLLVVQNFGATADPGETAQQVYDRERADVTADGVIVLGDLLEVVQRFEYTIPAGFDTDAGPTSEPNPEAASALPLPSTARGQLAMRIVELDTTPGLVVGEAFNLEIYMADGNTGEPIIGGYVDLNYDQSALMVGGVRYGVDYTAMQSGNLSAGSITNLGAVAPQMSPAAVSSSLVSIVRMTATRPGEARISIAPDTSFRGGIGLFSGLDVASQTDSTSLTINIGVITQQPQAPLPVPNTERGGTSNPALPLQPVNPQPTPTPLPALPVQGR